jgi:hypothetical protein
MSPPPHGLFAQQLARAAAQRGRLDPVYQVLSDHYTLMLQKLYPVWVLVGPGLSSPAHIEIHSRTVMLDSDRLLGDRHTIATGALDPFRILVSIGAGLHEVFHAAHTKPWIIERDIQLAQSTDPGERQLAEDRRLLEEPRMEAHGIRDHPAGTGRGRFVRKALRAAVADVIAPALTAEIALGTPLLGQPVTRELCGRSMTYLHARTHCDTIDPTTLTPLEPIWQHVLGAGDMQALDDLYARLVWIPDGDQDALDRAARDYRTIIGPPPAAPAAPEVGRCGHGSDGDTTGEDGPDATDTSTDTSTGAGAGDGKSGGRGPTIGSLREAIKDAIATGRRGELEQLDEDISLQELLAKQTGQHTDAPAPGSGVGTGLPTGRMPDRGVDRPPCPDEVQQAVRLATRLANARAAGFKRIDKRTPGGRFDARGYVRARAQRAANTPVTSRPWSIRREIRAPLQEPHVGLIIDTSGSMRVCEYALGPIAWILTSALHRLGGRVAICLFGNGCELLTDGTRPLPQVPGITTGGGTAFASDAIELVSGHLEMDNPRRPRFLYVVSDGGWADTQAGVGKVRWLRSVGVPTIHLSIGTLPPLCVEADRVCVLDDPASAMDVIANDTIEALRRGPAQRHAQPPTAPSAATPAG